jgi:gliding motility-associated-like protein
LVNITPINNVGTVEYLWNDGQSGNPRTNLAAGAYRIILTDANNCPADSTVTLTEPELINLAFQVTSPFCPDKPDGEIILTVTGGVVGADYSYLWSDNSTQRNISNISAGTYVVTVTDANVCSVEGSVEVTPLQKTCLIMSDVISPNGDMINDVWNIGNTDLYPNMEMTIYNRWGQSVWKSETGYPVPWDGKSNGVLLPVDSYHYIIDLHNGTKPILGDITIVR